MSRRLQLALNVNDIGQAVAFYTKLFGTEPAKIRPGYANFAIAEPPLKLVLLENPGQGGSLNHLGVEVPDTDTVEAEQARLAEAGLAAVRGEGHHLLLRQAGQVLGPGHTQRGVLGDLHGAGRQPDLLRRGPRPGVLRRHRRPRRGSGIARSRLLLAGTGGGRQLAGQRCAARPSDR